MTEPVYATCPSCGSSYPIGNQHDCPTHVRWPKEPSVSEAIRRSKTGLPWDHDFSKEDKR